MKKTKANRNYKDSLFRKLFGENKENALSLYNAINGTNYTLDDDFEYTTLEDVVYIKIKNDVSFIVGTSMSLYEHQSSYNPNMPLRGFLYFADLYRKIIEDNEKIYSSKVIRIPNPKYVVFYNGNSAKIQNDVVKLKLSDAFVQRDESGEFEWTATMVNINLKYNEELFEKCDILKQYSIFIGYVAEYNENMNTLEKAIDAAIERCIQENVLKDILMTQKQEVKNVVLTEFDQEKYDEMRREEGREEGIETGILLNLCTLVAKKRLTLKEALEECGLSKAEFMEKMKEFGLESSK